MNDLADQDSQFKNRTNLFPEEMKNGNLSLKLKTVNDKDKGIYTVSLYEGEHEVTASVTLTVESVKGSDKQDEAKEESTTGLIVGIVLACVFGLAVLAALAVGIYCVCKKHKAKGNSNTPGGGDNVRNNSENLPIELEEMVNAKGQPGKEGQLPNEERLPANKQRRQANKEEEQANKEGLQVNEQRRQANEEGQANKEGQKANEEGLLANEEKKQPVRRKGRPMRRKNRPFKEKEEPIQTGVT
ncbi:hypothetical protein WMY93_014268 [Mugilogobius chulae]|uniref:Immunoglobulin I-set domain-containing protein n=1 Tax=Mugilogobius chulae TaxID=88201 RepID=A0AAW0NV37_9GOBI